MPTAKLCVTGMAGEADEKRVEEQLLSEPGVFGAVASFRSDCVEVDYADDDVALERLFQLVREAGFEATLAG